MASLCCSDSVVYEQGSSLLLMSCEPGSVGSQLMLRLAQFRRIFAVSQKN